MEQLALRRLLLELGYRVAERQDQWCECLLLSEGERWAGTGLDADEALRDAIRHAFPSRASRTLLEQEGARRAGAPGARAEGAPPSAQPDSKVSAVSASDPEAAIAGAPAHTRSSCPMVLMHCRTRRTIFEIALRASVIGPSFRVDGRARISTNGAPSRSSGLTSRITGERRELADHAAAPALILLTGSRAPAPSRDLSGRGFGRRGRREHRAYAERASARVWPGSACATALPRPIDAVRELRSLRFVSADTWAEFAALAAEAIENARLEDRRPAVMPLLGCGTPGPSPTQPELMLAELTHEVEDLGGRLGSVPPEEVIPAADQMLVWVRKLRWLRSTVEDAERWGAVAGRLRYWVYKHRRELAAAERELNPEYSPEQNWSSVFDRATMQARRARRSSRWHHMQLRAESSMKLLVTRRRVGDRAALLETLTHLLRFSDTHHDRIVDAMRPYAAQIKDFIADDLPAGDRRLRRRLDKLKRALDPTDTSIAPDSVELDSQANDSQAEGDDEVSAHWSIPSGVRDRVVPFTRGKRAVHHEQERLRAPKNAARRCSSRVRSTSRRARTARDAT